MKLNICEDEICYTCKYGTQTECEAGIDDVFIDDARRICDCKVYEKWDCYKQIVDYLNKKLDTRYRSTGKKIRDLINARRNEGYDFEDFCKVIDNKYASWHGSKEMCQHLVPSTLFGPKFYQYLNEIPYQDSNKLEGKPTYDLDEATRKAMEIRDYF